MHVGGLGKAFFKAVNATLTDNIDILTKDDIIKIKHVITE